MNQAKLDNVLILFLRLGAFLCFAGWTWVHFYWEGPYGIFLWQEKTYAFVSGFGISWDQFVGTGANDGLVQKWIARMAWLYLACTVLTLTVRNKSWLQMAALLGGSVLLTILSYAKYLASQRELPMFIEHGGQMLIPVLLVMAMVLGVRHRVTVVTAMIAFIMTFAGHGSYAVGLWPTPSNFYGMITVILQVEYGTAQAILYTVGLLDFLVCIGIFIPRFRCASALYAAIWGLLTAIARPVAGMSWSLHYWGADQFLHEALIRAPHFLIPLYLYFLWRVPRQAESVVKNPESLMKSPDMANPPPLAPSVLTDKQLKHNETL